MAYCQTALKAMLLCLISLISSQHALIETARHMSQQFNQKKYPVTGFQWHPEKNAFEWGLSSIPHSANAIQVTQLAANHLVSEARKSLNRPSTEKVLSNLIYNYEPTYCGYEGEVTMKFTFSHNNDPFSKNNLSTSKLCLFRETSKICFFNIDM